MGGITCTLGGSVCTLGGVLGTLGGGTCTLEGTVVSIGGAGVWTNGGGLWRRSCGAVGTGVGGTLRGREMAAGAGRFGIIGTRVARLSRVTIFSKLFFCFVTCFEER